MHSSNHIIKFVIIKHTTVVGLISKNDESAYREEVQRLTAWCKANNLFLNVEKTKEMVVDFRRAQSDHSPLNINGSNMEIVKSIKFLGLHLAEDLTWSLNTQLHHQESPAAFLLPAKAEEGSSSTSHPDHLLQRDHREHPEQLHHCLVWELHRVGSQDPAARIVRTAEKIIGVSLFCIMDICSTRCIRKANSIVDDPTRPSHTLFTLLPSGKRWICQFYK
ncbi:hypothetical protein QTP86_000320 [Hemibagrus guttatus]|nr:hypothetical protein QTP86_000320 [Hemibagrus guttatus]